MLWIDLETYNEVKDIKAGVYEYARTCEILLVAYAFDKDPVQLWDRTKESIPDDLKKAFENPETKYTAHNAQFDRIVLRDSKLFGDYVGDPHNWDCTMVKAMLHGFTGSLDKLGEIFGLGSDEAKIKEGKKLINRFCKPAPKNHKADRYTSETHPEEWQRFCDYAVRDVAAMRKIASKIPNWNWEPAEYHLDQVINGRGFRVDVELVRAGARAAAQEKIALAERFVQLTNGAVASPTQRAKFLEYLNDQFNLGLENTQKATLEPLLKDDDLDVRARALIEIALAANKTSTAKYATLEPAVSPDGRFRGGLQFSGATRTRRFAGRTFQPQNLPSKGIPKSSSINIYIDALKAGVHDVLFSDELMKYGSAALRGVLIAPKGKKNCVSDLSNIEGRADAWLAGEEWKLQAFRDYDRGEGPDLYKVAAGKILGKTPQAIVENERNSFGKVTELALGYQGGVGAIQNFATTMGVAFADHWEAIQQSVDQAVINQAYDNWESWGKEKAQDTPQDEWIASEVVKLSWRASHPQIVKLWHACEDAARSALNNPGKVFKAGKHLHFKYVRYAGRNYLLMRLPSNKFLVYFGPKQNEEGKISYWGVDAITKQWSRQHIYGGKFCISKGTEVLTDTGWLPIQDVTRKNKIWDGLEWVSCDGSIYQGNKETIEAHGVRMTPDHLVLTVEGWKHASQSERYNRAESRLPNSGKVSWQRWEKIPMASSVCLRQPSNYTSFGTEKTKEKGNNRILWMQKAFNDRKEEYNSRNVETSVICGMAFNESSMHKPQSQSMEKLWRQGHNCLRKVARFLRELSRGYAVNLPTGLNAGTSGQFEGLPFKELRLGYAEGTGEQHSEHTVHQYPKGPDVGVTGSEKIQNRSLNSCVSDREQRARKVLVRETRQKEQVYDLINCGPRNRFVVKDKNGQPLIVHNCENACQSLSRDILMQGIFSAEKAGYKPVLTVHDELVTECPDTDEFSEQGLSKILSTPLNWCPGFPLAAEGFEAYRYRK